MKHLLLLRHAKSERTAAGGDFDRALAARGRAAAPPIGSYIAKHGPVPELILCSTARRARETLDLVLPALGPVPVRHLRELYLASPAALLAEIAKADDAASALMAVGHNPGLHHLALDLTGAGDPDLRTKLQGSFPTAGLAVLSFMAESWVEVGEGGGKLDAFVTPKDP